ncbi:hypothetical protein ES705_30594 [subsurface metagenome]
MKERYIIKERPHNTSKFYIQYGFTLREIANIFQVSTTTVYNWLNDERKCEWLKRKLRELEIVKK